MSSLYFRGKVVYARQILTRGASPNSRIFIIAPGFGLVEPEWRLTAQRTDIMQHVRVDPMDPRFRAPLEDHARGLNVALDESSRVILLGSLASDKYVSILSPIFGHRLVAPRSFVGIGDMSRGALLLRTAMSRTELDYIPVSETGIRTRRRSSASYDGSAPARGPADLRRRDRQ